MKITIISIGKPQLSLAKQEIEEYLRRTSRFIHIEHIPLKENKESGQKIQKHCTGKKLILLDEHGKLFTTQELSQFLEKEKNISQDLCFIIGGADGHSKDLLARADMLWALSPLTFPHDIALMLTIEAVYRALSIHAGHPYHRA